MDNNLGNGYQNNDNEEKKESRKTTKNRSKNDVEIKTSIFWNKSK